MESYLIDPAVLEKIIDGFISEKYPDQPIEKFNNIKKEAMRALDHQVMRNVLGSLTKEQGEELEALLDKNDSDPDAFTEFFSSRSIDLQEILKNTMVKFKKDFLEGGKNA